MQRNYLTQPPTNLTTLIDMVAQQLLEHQVFFGHGTNDAFDESVWICLWALQLPINSDLNQIAQCPITTNELATIEQILHQRIALRKPTAYITKQAWLQGFDFYIDERSIIPRSFIAELIVNQDIDIWLAPNSNKVLDLCTGNASLAIITALNYPNLHIDAADISKPALEVAQINLDKYQLNQRIQLIESDLFSNINQSYDLILCNPPYVNSASMQQLPKEYQQEPQLALAGGVDGMDFIRNLLAQARQYLTDNGILIIEIGNELANFEQAFTQLNPFWLTTSGGDDRVLLLTKDALPK